MTTGKTLLRALVVVTTLILVEGCAPRQYVPKTNEEIYGTWTNPNSALQKLVFFPDGTWKQFTYPTDPVPSFSGTYQIVQKWKDAEGNTWYQENSRVLVGVYKYNKQVLNKIDKTGNSLESIFQEVGQFDNKNYPKELDSKSESYSIAYRSEK